jgi:hypothetical protein
MVLRMPVVKAYQKSHSGFIDREPSRIRHAWRARYLSHPQRPAMGRALNLALNDRRDDDKPYQRARYEPRDEHKHEAKQQKAHSLASI